MNSQGVKKARRARRGSMRAELRVVHVSAFTLVELLVVIAIIAILISLLLPSLRGVADASRLVTCRSNLRRIVAAALAYGQDRNGQLPDHIGWGNPGSSERYWNHSMVPYLGLPRIRNHAEIINTYYDTVLTCPGARVFPGPVARRDSWLNAFNMTYALNAHLAGSSALRQSQPEHNNYWPRLGAAWRAPMFIHRIPDPSGAGFFFDAITCRWNHPAPGLPRAYRSQDNAGTGNAFKPNLRPRYYYIHRFRGNRNRDHEWTHDEDAINVGYADGRAEATTRLWMEAQAATWRTSAFWGN